jgi:hypothetical protein
MILNCYDKNINLPKNVLTYNVQTIIPLKTTCIVWMKWKDSGLLNHPFTINRTILHLTIYNNRATLGPRLILMDHVTR